MMKLTPLKSALLCALIALGAVTVPAYARVSVDINVGVPPPELRYEAVPQARAGYLWAPGYWGWDGGRHRWHDGRWVGERSGYRYTPERWEQRGDRYHYRAARWDQDSRRSDRGRQYRSDRGYDHRSDRGYDHEHGDDRGQREHARGHSDQHGDH